MQSQGRIEDVFSPDSRGALEARLAAYVTERRWFRSRTRKLLGASVLCVMRLPGDVRETVLTVVRIRFEEGLDEDYVLPLTWIQGESADHLTKTRPDLVVGAIDVKGEDRPRWLIDATGDRHALEGLYALFAQAAAVSTGEGDLHFRAIEGGLRPFPAGSVEPRPIHGEQSNTSIVFGRVCVVKIIRKLEEGMPADVEMGEALTRAGYAHAPRLLAVAELRRPGAEVATIATAHAFVPNEGDAWPYALASIARLAEEPARAGRSVQDEASALASTLATRVAELHAVLAAPSQDRRFSPEPIERAEREALGADLERTIDSVWALLEDPERRPEARAAERLGALRRRAPAFREVIARFVASRAACVKTRVHGDLHLGQVLVSGGDLVLIDFEGEPARSLAARKAKRSPLVDVAGVLRSLHYASVAAVRTKDGADSARPALRKTAEAWHVAARRAFLVRYFEAAAGRTVLPEDPAERAAMLRFYLLEKCVYELHYELGSRPDWAIIPVAGLERVLEETDAG